MIKLDLKFCHQHNYLYFLVILEILEGYEVHVT